MKTTLKFIFAFLAYVSISYLIQTVIFKIDDIRIAPLIIGAIVALLTVWLFGKYKTRKRS